MTAQKQSLPSFASIISVLSIVFYCAGFLRVEFELNQQKERITNLENVADAEPSSLQPGKRSVVIYMILQPGFFLSLPSWIPSPELTDGMIKSVESSYIFVTDTKGMYRIQSLRVFPFGNETKRLTGHVQSQNCLQICTFPTLYCVINVCILCCILAMSVLFLQTNIRIFVLVCQRPRGLQTKGLKRVYLPRGGPDYALRLRGSTLSALRAFRLTQEKQ